MAINLSLGVKVSQVQIDFYKRIKLPGGFDCFKNTFSYDAVTPVKTIPYVNYVPSPPSKISQSLDFSPPSATYTSETNLVGYMTSCYEVILVSLRRGRLFLFPYWWPYFWLLAYFPIFPCWCFLIWLLTCDITCLHRVFDMMITV